MASIKYENVYLNDYFTIGGKVESEGLIKNYNITLADYYYGEKTFEDAEVKMQRVVIDNLLRRVKLKDKNIDLVVGGELSNQIATTNYTLKNYDIPFLGVYSACASFIESLIILANMIGSSIINKGIALTSSHNLTSEKQFRFPCEYGAPKPDYTTFTATGCVGALISSEFGIVKLESATIGKVIDKNIKDVFHMGAVMAPGAADTLNRHLKDLHRDSNYYDVIITGDLGSIGKKIFLNILNKQYKIKLKNHLDAACEIYADEQKTLAGASGPAALPLYLCTKVLREKKYKKILLIGTGALHSPVMINQKHSIPGIAHLISLEVQ